MYHLLYNQQYWWMIYWYKDIYISNSNQFVYSPKPYLYNVTRGTIIKMVYLACVNVYNWNDNVHIILLQVSISSNRKLGGGGVGRSGCIMNRDLYGQWPGSCVTEIRLFCYVYIQKIFLFFFSQYDNLTWKLKLKWIIMKMISIDWFDYNQLYEIILYKMFEHKFF